MEETATFAAAWPWRRWLAGLALAAAAAGLAGAFLLPLSLQVAIAQFMIPPYAYTCLGLAVIALAELKEPVGRRIFMALALAALALLHLFTFAVGRLGPLAPLGVHVGFLIGWIALPRRAGWTALWLAQTLAWIGAAFAQGRLP